MISLEEVEALRHILSRTPMTPPEFLWTEAFLGRLLEMAATQPGPPPAVTRSHGEGPSELNADDFADDLPDQPKE